MTTQGDGHLAELSGDYPDYESILIQWETIISPS